MAGFVEGEKCPWCWGEVEVQPCVNIFVWQCGSCFAIWWCSQQMWDGDPSASEAVRPMFFGGVAGVRLFDDWLAAGRELLRAKGFA